MGRPAWTVRVASNVLLSPAEEILIRKLQMIFSFDLKDSLDHCRPLMKLYNAVCRVWNCLWSTVEGSRLAITATLACSSCAHAPVAMHTTAMNIKQILRMPAFYYGINDIFSYLLLGFCQEGLFKAIPPKNCDLVSIHAESRTLVLQ